VVVDHGQLAVGGQVHVALDEVAADFDRRLERSQGVLGMLGRISPVAAQHHPPLGPGGLQALPDRIRALHRR
jgi:hypothetical protein